jgi:hypothetical protein
LRTFLRILIFLLLASPALAQVNVQTLTAPGPTVSLQTKNNQATLFNVTLTGNVTAASMDSGFKGQQANFNICQNSVGGFTWAWPATFQGTSSVTIAPGASVCTQAQFINVDGTTWQLTGGGSSGGLPGGGTVGQALINTGPGAGTWQDPNVSYNTVNLFTTVSATSTQTSAKVRNSTFSQNGTFLVTWATITGAPVGCTLQVNGVDSVGNVLANGSTIAVAPANGTTSIGFTANGVPTAAQISVIYNCSTTFPTTGTLTLDFAPTVTTSITGNNAISNGTWVNTTDVIWNQVTLGFNGGSAATACCSVTNFTVDTNFRILRPDGTIYDAHQQGTSWAITIGSSNNSVCGTGQTFPVSGWLQSVVTDVTAATGGSGVVQPGQAFTNLYILKTLPTSGSTSTCQSTLALSNGFHLLASGPISLFYPCGWGTGVAACVGPSAQMPGAISAYRVTDVAAGTATETFTPPNTNRVIPIAISFQFTTSNQAGNRVVCLFINSGGFDSAAAAFYTCAAGVQPPSTTMQYTAYVGVGAASGGNAFSQTIPLPVTLDLPAIGTNPWQISVNIASGIQSNDQISLLRVLARTYQEAN